VGAGVSAAQPRAEGLREERVDAERDDTGVAGSDRAGRQCLGFNYCCAVDGGVCGAAEWVLLLKCVLVVKGIQICNFKRFDL